MREIIATTRLPIPLGKQGENEAVVVKFPVAGWRELYGEGSFSLLCEREGDTSAYPCVITVEDDFVLWVVKAADVYNAGEGKAQLLYIVGEKVAKSVIYSTIVFPSLDAGDMPEPTPEWILDVMNSGLDAEAYAVGERNGEPVSEDDPAYHNNAKWFAENVADSVFWVDPFSETPTTKNELQAAIDNGKYPIIKYNSNSVIPSMQLPQYLPLAGVDVSFVYTPQTGNTILYYYKFIKTAESNAVIKCTLTYNATIGNESWSSVSSSYPTVPTNSIANVYLRQPYEVGAYAFYNGTLYKCKTKISSAEDFTSSHWTRVTLVNEIPTYAPSASLFWCEYGVTTYQQIANAFNEGLLPAVVYTGSSNTNPRVAYLYTITGSFAVFYGATSDCTMWELQCSSFDTWTKTQKIVSVAHRTASGKFVYGSSSGNGDTIVYYDDAPTENSNNILTSGAVYTDINKIGALLINKGLITQVEWDAR